MAKLFHSKGLLILFFIEFVLNHLHSSHKHRRFNGDSLDMTMVVPQVDVETNSNSIRWAVFSVLQKFFMQKYNIRTPVCDHSIMQESGVNHKS